VSEPYRLNITRTARRALSERLPVEAAGAVIEFLRGPLSENPYRVGAPLNAPFEGQYRARRGEYRVRYRIDEEQWQVVVLDIDHRHVRKRANQVGGEARVLHTVRGSGYVLRPAG